MPQLCFDPAIERDDIFLSRDIALEAEMRLAETTGQFNHAAPREVHRNNSVCGKNIDQGTADPASGACYDDDAFLPAS